MRPLRSKLSEIYGPIEDWKWTNQSRFMTIWKIPMKMYGFLKYEGTAIRRIYLNKDMVPSLSLALEMVYEGGLMHKIESYDGCFNLRYSRNSGEKLSTHAYGLALDLNAATNPLGATPQIDDQLVMCFEEAGFVWGGRWKRPDGMHFQFVTED